ncbi:MAG: hypothetical protein K2X86_18920 [Cytophagaceae bacterium]|nr:hypothetical protein [Cytophagaceae bacterium]
MKYSLIIIALIFPAIGNCQIDSAIIYYKQTNYLYTPFVKITDKKAESTLNKNLSNLKLGSIKDDETIQHDTIYWEYNKDNILTYTFTSGLNTLQDDNETGLKRPGFLMHWYAYSKSYNLKTGQPLKIEDLIKENEKGTIFRLLAAKLPATYKDLPCAGSDHTFDSTEVSEILKTVVVNKYGIDFQGFSCTGQGKNEALTPISFELSEIKHLLDPEKLLGSFLLDTTQYTGSPFKVYKIEHYSCKFSEEADSILEERLHFSYPLFKKILKADPSWINKKISEWVGDLEPSCDKIINNYEYTDELRPAESEGSYSIGFINKNILCIVFNSSSYACCGANGATHEYHTFNFNLNSKKEISISEIINEKELLNYCHPTKIKNSEKRALQ